MKPFDIDGIPVAALIQDAWNAWQEVADISVDCVDAPENGNVVINFTKIDGNGKVLADATVGEGRGVFFRMVMRIDSDENWIATKFKGVITHEIGHMLGLHHSEVPRNLMNAFYQSDINEPKGDDISRVRQIWGASHGTIPPGEPIPLPPGI